MNQSQAQSTGQGKQIPLFVVVGGTDAEQIGKETTPPKSLNDLWQEMQQQNMSIGEQFDVLWAKACAAFDASAAAIDELREFEQCIMPAGESYQYAIKLVDGHDLGKIKTKLNHDMVYRLVLRASNMFSPNGGRLSIDSSEIQEKFEYDKEQPNQYSFKAIWDYLEETYGGQAGEDETWRQVASSLIDEFGMRRNEEVVRKGSRTILSKRVYLDDFYKKNYGRNTLHYGCKESVLNAIMTLKSFATWHQNIALAHDLQQLHGKFWLGTAQDKGSLENFESRAQHKCGDDQEIIIVLYTNKVEFKLSDACAAQLQLFLGTYGNLNRS